MPALIRAWHSCDSLSGHAYLNFSGSGFSNRASGSARNFPASLKYGAIARYLPAGTLLPNGMATWGSVDFAASRASVIALISVSAAFSAAVFGSSVSAIGLALPYHFQDFLIGQAGLLGKVVGC